MGNVDNVHNGTYLGIGCSASHRFSIQWTGDIDSNGDALAQEVSNLVRCSNNCIPYVNADCGGHIGNPDKGQFIRWMQFGVLSPVFRPHCTNSVIRTREPWVYDEETLDIVRELNNMRYRLLPVIYKNAFSSYLTGEPIFKGLGWEYPQDKRALKNYDEYMLGNDILVAPVMGTVPTPLDKHHYASSVKAEYFDGINLEGDPLCRTEYETLDMILNHVAPEKEVPIYNFSARFETEIVFDRDIDLILCCDDGATVWIDGKKVFEDKTFHSARNFPLGIISGNRTHSIKVEYFQGGGEASCRLLYKEAGNNEYREIYLPAGKWMDVFDGKVYSGGKTAKKEYDIYGMPLFVRLGALLPLAYAANNTKNQKWDNLVFDFYPCKEANDSGYIYEDDAQTTAYKKGEYRKSAYTAAFDEAENAFTVKLCAAVGEFKGERAFKERELTFKYHLLSGVDSVKKVTVNGADAHFEKSAKNPSVYPFGTGAACDNATLNVKFKADVAKDYVIKFYL